MLALLDNEDSTSFIERFVKVLVSIIAVVPVSVFLGYGGWIVLTLSAIRGGYDRKQRTVTCFESDYWRGQIETETECGQIGEPNFRGNRDKT
jgi:hypothetical protein